MRMLKTWGIVVASLLGLASPAMAQAVPLAAAEVAYTQNFDTLSNTAASSVLPLGWALSETGTSMNTTYSVGAGTSATGDTYSFGVAAATDRAFGTLQSGSVVPTIGAQFTNTSGAAFVSVTINYHGEQWRVGQTTALDRLDFQYSLDATDLTTGTWVDVNGLDFPSPETGTGTAGARVGNDATHQVTVMATVTFAAPLSNGAHVWIRWTDPDAMPGSDDGLAVDDFSLTPHAASTTTGNVTFDVFFDTNANGTHDAGENGIGSWGVALDGGAFMPTAADGSVTFTGVSSLAPHPVTNMAPAAAGTWMPMFPATVSAPAGGSMTYHVPVTCTCPDDGNLCTSIPVCNAGACPSPTPVSCTDSNPCTDDACTMATGLCTHTNNTATCNDGMMGTRNDVCAAGTCAGMSYTCTPGVCEMTSTPNGVDCTIVFSSAVTTCGASGSCDHCSGTSSTCVATTCGVDAGTDAGSDAGSDAGFDAGSDAGSDAATLTDAGTDAASTVDANLPDTGVHDAGHDGGARDAGATDGSMHADAGHVTPPPAMGNCGCSTTGSSAPSALGLGLLVLGLIARRNRRSRR